MIQLVQTVDGHSHKESLWDQLERERVIERVLHRACKEKWPISVLEVVGLPERIINTLEWRAGIRDIPDLLQWSAEDLRYIQNVGVTAVKQIRESLCRLPELESAEAAMREKVMVESAEIAKIRECSLEGVEYVPSL